MGVEILFFRQRSTKLCLFSCFVLLLLPSWTRQTVHPLHSLLTTFVQIAQDDNNFEINSLRDSLDIDSDAEDHPKSTHTPPDSTSSTRSAPRNPPRSPIGGYGDSGIGSRNFSGTTAFSGGGSGAGNRGRDSPLPAPTPKRVSSLPRESLDGETIFSVGGDEEDKWSEDGGDGEEREELVGRKNRENL